MPARTMVMKHKHEELIQIHNAINACTTQADAMRIAARLVLMHSETRKLWTLAARFESAMSFELFKEREGI